MGLLVGVVMGCMDGDEFVRIVEDCALHHAGWVRVMEKSVGWWKHVGGLMSEWLCVCLWGVIWLHY